jgi:predicted RNA-binding Zn-ribbon protein involved in translation (DUF1610 family)
MCVEDGDFEAHLSCPDCGLNMCEEGVEFCEYCEEYVELSQELKVQRCPKCGKWIVPCSACPLEGCYASRCPLERMAQLLNKE